MPHDARSACREEGAFHEPRSDSQILMGGGGFETRSPIRVSEHAANCSVGEHAAQQLTHVHFE